MEISEAAEDRDSEEQRQIRAMMGHVQNLLSGRAVLFRDTPGGTRLMTAERVRILLWLWCADFPNDRYPGYYMLQATHIDTTIDNDLVNKLNVTTLEDEDEDEDNDGVKVSMTRVHAADHARRQSVRSKLRERVKDHCLEDGLLREALYFTQLQSKSLICGVSTGPLFCFRVNCLHLSLSQYVYYLVHR